MTGAADWRGSRSWSSCQVTGGLDSCQVQWGLEFLPGAGGGPPGEGEGLDLVPGEGEGTGILARCVGPGLLPGDVGLSGSRPGRGREPGEAWRGSCD